MAGKAKIQREVPRMALAREEQAKVNPKEVRIGGTIGDRTKGKARTPKAPEEPEAEKMRNGARKISPTPKRMGRGKTGTKIGRIVGGRTTGPRKGKHMASRRRVIRPCRQRVTRSSTCTCWATRWTLGTWRPSTSFRVQNTPKSAPRATPAPRAHGQRAHGPAAPPTSPGALAGACTPAGPTLSGPLALHQVRGVRVVRAHAARGR